MMFSPQPGLYGDDPPASGRMGWNDAYNIRWRLKRAETIGLWRAVLDPGGSPMGLDTTGGGECRSIKVAPRASGAQVLFGQLNRVEVMTPSVSGSSISAGTRWEMYRITWQDLSPITDGLGPDLGRTRVNPVWWFVPLGDAILMGRAGVDEPMFIWDRDPAHPMVPIEGSPQGAVAVFTTDNGYIVALGCTPVSGSNSALTVRWCSQGNVMQWDPLPSDSTAGDLLLPEGSRIVGGGPTSLGSLIWTDTDVWELVPRPYPVIFEPQRLARRAGLLSNTAWAEAGGRVWWVGSDGGVWTLDGSRPSPLPCPIKSTTFDSLSREAAHRTFATSNAEFSEVAFWLPSGADGSIQGAVTYNYEEQAWSRWQMQRMAWSDRSGPLRPLAVDANGAIWEHELPAVDDTPSWRNEQVERRPWMLRSGHYYPTQTPEQETFGTFRCVIDRAVRHTPGDESAMFTATFSGHDWTAVTAASSSEVTYWWPSTEYQDVRVAGRTQGFRIEGNDRSYTRIGDMWMLVDEGGERA